MTLAKSLNLQGLFYLGQIVTFGPFHCSTGYKQALMTKRTIGLSNATVILIYAVLVYKALLQYPILSPPPTILLVLKTIFIFTLFGGSHLGGALLYKHGMGIDAKTT